LGIRERLRIKKCFLSPMTNGTAAHVLHTKRSESFAHMPSVVTAAVWGGADLIAFQRDDII